MPPGGWRARPTVYRGIEFRSRLESRWARFFDALDVVWEYEPITAKLERAWYVPDFRLLNVGDGWWFEVKGPEPSEARPFELLEELSVSTAMPVALAWGDMPRGLLDRQGLDVVSGDRVGRDILAFRRGGNAWDDRYEFCVCENCGRIGLEFECHVERVCPTHGYGSNWDASAPVNLAYSLAGEMP